MRFDTEKWSHRATPLYMTLLVLGGPLGLLPEHWWTRIINVAFLLPAIGLIILGQIHGERFCEYCATSSPADGPGAARKKRRSLKFYHRFCSVWGLLYLALVIATPMVLPRVWPSFIGWAVLMPGFLWMIWAIRVHNLLKPWCPWCNHGRGDGDGLAEPTPGPTYSIPIPVSQETL